MFLVILNSKNRRSQQIAKHLLWIESLRYTPDDMRQQMFYITSNIFFYIRYQLVFFINGSVTFFIYVVSYHYKE